MLSGMDRIIFQALLIFFIVHASSREQCEAYGLTGSDLRISTYNDDIRSWGLQPCFTFSQLRQINEVSVTLLVNKRRHVVKRGELRIHTHLHMNVLRGISAKSRTRSSVPEKIHVQQRERTVLTQHKSRNTYGTLVIIFGGLKDFRVFAHAYTQLGRVFGIKLVNWI